MPEKITQHNCLTCGAGTSMVGVQKTIIAHFRRDATTGDEKECHGDAEVVSEKEYCLSCGDAVRV